MTKVNVADAPAAKDAIVQLIVPVAPTAGALHANDGPAVCIAETKVVPVGTTSDSATVAASLGPPLLTLTVYVMLLPGLTVPAPAIFETDRSAKALTVEVTVAVLLKGLE